MDDSGLTLRGDKVLTVSLEAAKQLSERGSRIRQLTRRIAALKKFIDGDKSSLVNYLANENHQKGLAAYYLQRMIDEPVESPTVRELTQMLETSISLEDVVAKVSR